MLAQVWPISWQAAIGTRLPGISELIDHRRRRVLLRQMGLRTTYRVLTIYSFALGILGIFLLTVTNRVGQRLTFGKPLIGTNWLSSGLINMLQQVVVGVAMLGGAMLVGGPLPQKSAELIDDFARRFLGEKRLNFEFRPSYGALLVARLAVIVPLCLTVGLLSSERRLSLAGEILCVMTRFIAAACLIACASGALATWLSRKKLRWPVTFWFALWVVPEIARLVSPSTPTLRSATSWFLTTAAGTWGPH